MGGLRQPAEMRQRVAGRGGRRRWRALGPLVATGATLGVLWLAAATFTLPDARVAPAPPPVRVVLQQQGTPSTNHAGVVAATIADPAVPVEPVTEVPPPEPPVADPVDEAPAAATGEAAASVAGVVQPGAVQSPAGASGAPSAFMGVRENYRRVVIAFDVADSVRRKAELAGVPLERVRDEAAALVDRLDGRSAFGLIQFVRRYEAFQPHIVAATPENRAAALEWLAAEFRTNGRSGRDWQTGEPDGIELVLDAALRMEPEVLFIISDGDFQRTEGRGGRDVDWQTIEDQAARWQAAHRKRVRIHVIGIQMEPEQEAAARKFVQRFGGQLRLL